MSKIKYGFKYKKTGPYKRPLITITLRYQGKEINSLVLVDSGADFNVFHADLASLLNLDLNKLQEKEFGGIKEDKKPCKGRLAVIEIGINGDFFDAPVIFSSDISTNGYGVLGQIGFFEHFKIVFDFKTDHIYLKKP